MSDCPTRNRRPFVRAATAGLAAVSTLTGCVRTARNAAPLVMTDTKKGLPPSERVVMAVIGTGELGRRWHLEDRLMRDDRVEFGAICDLDENRRALAAGSILRKRGHKVPMYHDFRKLLEQKDIDAVLIATPDHWHALTALAAIEAGKDVYCEKPLTLTIEEGQALVAAARRYGTVFQTGSQQRSHPRFRLAVEIMRNRLLGDIRKIETRVGQVGPGEWQPIQTPPAGFDWNFWLGPRPYVDYMPVRSHHTFRWFYDYSGGKLTDWGAHHNDIAQWALDMDGSGPVEIDGRGEFFTDGPYDVPHTFVIHYKYANGVEVTCRTAPQDGVHFECENGWLFVNRNRIEASEPAVLRAKFTRKDKTVYFSEDHHNNFFDCIRSRKRCICDVEIGHRSATVCHLGNISIRLGRSIKWDPEKEQIIGDEAANRMVGRPMRAPWHL